MSRDLTSSVLREDFDAEAVPRLNAVAEGTDLPGGVAPEAIADPALRAAYEAQLDRNRADAENYARRDAQRRAAQASLDRSERRVIAASVLEPGAQDELATELKQLLGHAADRKRILDAIRHFNEG